MLKNRIAQLRTTAGSLCVLIQLALQQTSAWRRQGSKAASSRPVAELLSHMAITRNPYGLHMAHTVQWPQHMMQCIFLPELKLLQAHTTQICLGCPLGACHLRRLHTPYARQDTSSAGLNDGHDHASYHLQPYTLRASCRYSSASNTLAGRPAGILTSSREEHKNCQLLATIGTTCI